MGGIAAVVAGANVSPPLAGVVSVSSPARFRGMDGVKAGPRLRVPVLYVAATADDNGGYDFSEDAKELHRAAASKDKRLDAETRLKSGQLRALVATASLELGIDIGHVDLVCQIGSPHRIATLLQRVGRSGHTIAGTPKGRVFPVSRDDLVECGALLRSIRSGLLDAIVSHDGPLDVLAQQIVAEVATREWREDELYALARRAWPYRALPRDDFVALVSMLAQGFSTRRGRRGATSPRPTRSTRCRRPPRRGPSACATFHRAIG